MKNTRRIVFVTGALLLALVLACGTVSAEEALMGKAKAKGFSNRDLAGTCVWQSISVRTDRISPPAAATMIAQAEFDGNGSVVLNHAHTNFDGVMVDENYQGTYQVNPDGDGTITFNFAAPQHSLVYDIQLSRSKHVVRFIRAEDISPQPIGSSSEAIDSDRVSVGVCKMDE